MSGSPTVAPAARLPLALVGVLLLGLALTAIGFSWGLPTSTGGTWAYDELSPADSPLEVKTRHGGRYPPLHYWLLEGAYAPVKLLDRVGAVDLSKSEMANVLRLVGRSLSVLMSVASLWLVYRLAHLALGRPQPAILAAAVMALSPTWVYYSKLTNLEVPYVFWFLVAAVFSLRILERHRMRDYLGFAFGALFSITTKDQAFALFILPSLAFPFLLAKRETGRARLGDAARALLDTRLVLPAGLGLVGFALIHNMVFDWSGFLHHIWMMTGPTMQVFAEHPPTLAGHAAMAWQGVGHIRFVLGTGVALAALGGLALLVRERRYRALWLLLFAVSYYLLFITPIRYHYDRFFLPIAPLLAVFAGHFLWRLASPRRSYRLARRLAVVAVLGVALGRAVMLDAAMVCDSRYEVERWVAEKEAAGFTVAGYRAAPTRLPRISRFLSWRPLRRHGAMSLVKAGSPDYLVFDPVGARSHGAQDRLPRLLDGSYGYRWERAFTPIQGFDALIPPGVRTNLDNISPVMTAARRTVELYFDAPKAVDELWSGQRNDWREVGDRFLEAPVAPGRLSLGRGLVAFNIYPDRWTRGSSRALLARRNPGPSADSPELVLFTGNRPGPTRARVVAPGLDLEVELAPGERRAIPLADVQPGEVAIATVAANQAWERAGEVDRELGVRVRLKTAH